MPKVDLSKIPVKTSTIYPPPYDQLVNGRTSQRIGDAGGLTQFGANLVRLEPGAAASMRHWHEVEDEFLIVVSGELVLVEEGSETPMRVMDCATFKAGVANAHHMVNRSNSPGSFLVVGPRNLGVETCHYPDQGLKVVLDDTGAHFSRSDGSPL